MRETHFISQNKKNWEEFESLLEAKAKDPEKLSDLFIQITDDLAYARTHYPNRAIRVYLNNLARKIFSAVYIKRETGNILKGLVSFFRDEAPALVWRARYEMLICLVIFLLSFLAGVISSRHDTDFATYILGPEYVAMTEKNIQAGDPMAVYKQQHEATMFMGISYNNLFVSFKVYVFGLLFGIGSLAMLIYNGIMVGTFQYFFIPRGAFTESFATIWLHGVPEIFAIIFSSGAGLRLARGLVFPDTYSRLQSFQNSAWESLRLMICIIPVFLFAAFIEGFVTRYTELPVPARIFFITLNFILIITYFILYPYNKARNGKLKEIKNVKVITSPVFIYKPGSIYSSTEIIKGALSYFGSNFKWILRISIFFAVVVATFFHLFPVSEFISRITDEIFFVVFQKLYIVSDYRSPVMFIFNSFFFTFILLASIRSIKKHFRIDNTSLSLLQIVIAFITVAALNSLFFIEEKNLALFIWCLLFPIVVVLNYFLSTGTPVDEALNNAVTLPFTGFINFIGSSFLLYILFFLFSLLVNSPLFYFYKEIISWNFDTNVLDKSAIFFNYFSNLLATYLFSPFLIAGLVLISLSLSEIKTASQLLKKINSIKGK